MTITPETMRHTLRHWASGVSVVTTTNGDERAGMTVSAFSSLCLEPPLIVVSVYKGTRTAKMIQDAGVFAVSILHADQVEVADRFAGRIPLSPGEDRFDGVPTLTAETGSPIIEDAIAWLDCRVFAVNDGVTHWIIVGEVLATGTREDDNAPLLYFDRAYRELARQPERP